MKTITNISFKRWQALPPVTPAVIEPPQGPGVRQSSGALESVGARKRQRTGALQDADAHKDARNCSDSAILQPP